MTYEILIAGFGGQGVMAMGKSIAEACVKQQLNVSWLPSYGPEMRGGTANCSVVVSDGRITTPIVLNGNALVVMNNPSLTKYEQTLQPGGLLMIIPGTVSDLAGFAVLAAIFVLQTIENKKEKKAASV